MLAVYEFELFEDGEVTVAVPFGLEGGTQGAGYADACAMAAEWLKGEAEQRMMTGQSLPEPSFGNDPEHGGRVAIVAVDADPGTVPTVAASEAAEMLGVSRPRISQMLASGLLEGYRKGGGTFVTVASVEARLAEAPKAGRPKALR